jgi:hypothetical protein
MILEANWERLKEEYNYEYASSCGVTYGTVFKKDYWDTSTIHDGEGPAHGACSRSLIRQRAQVVGQEEREVLDPETGH